MNLPSHRRPIAGLTAVRPTRIIKEAWLSIRSRASPPGGVAQMVRAMDS
jgi:hypothetical protein